MITITICEEDSKLLERCLKLFDSVAKEANLEITINSIKSGVMLLKEWEDRENQTDILYLAVKSEKINGMEVARALRKRRCRTEIVFLAEDLEEVENAFDVEAFHYIVKGKLNEQRFVEIFTRLLNKIRRKRGQFVTLSYGGENRNVALNSIKYFQVNKRIVTVFYGQDQSFEFYSTMDKIENTFYEMGFTRISRSVIVRNAYVQGMTSTEVILEDGRTLAVGKNYRRIAKERVTGENNV